MSYLPTCLLFLGPLSNYTINTPVSATVLEQYLLGYEHADEIIKGFKEGFHLGLKETQCIKRKTTHQTQHPELSKKILSEIENGFLLGPFTEKPHEDLHISPVRVVPKPNGKWRLIFNLSYPRSHSVNDAIADTCKPVTYPSVLDVVEAALHSQTPYFLAKVDLKDAYRIVPLHPSQWKWLGMKVDGMYFIDRCLPMGASSSCAIFQKISNCLAWITVNRFPDSLVFNYLDDFLFLETSTERCREVLEFFQRLCQECHIPIAHHKTEGPTKQIKFLGIDIDMEHRTLSVPEEKRKSTLHHLEKFIKQEKATIKEWQKLLGILCHLSQVVPAGRAHMSSLYGALKGTLSQNQNLIRNLSSLNKAELQLWTNFLESPVANKPFSMLDSHRDADMVAHTDASGIGYGCIKENEWFCGTWPTNWKQQSIAARELFPILVAVKFWEKSWENKIILFYTDNKSLVPVITKLYSKNAKLAQLIQPIALSCMRYNILLRATHLPGEENTAADLLSRMQITTFLNSFPGVNRTPEPLPSFLSPRNWT